MVMTPPKTEKQPNRRPRDYDADWMRQHLDRERSSADLLGEIREAVFGAQDGVLSTLALVTTVGSATAQSRAVLIAGLAGALAGMIAMAAGEYMSSKSQREVFEAQISGEEKEVRERPAEAEAEVAYLFQRDGLDADTSFRVARDLAGNKRVLLKIMVEQELGVIARPDENLVRGSIIMGITFGLAAIVPVAPYLVFSLHTALIVSVVLTALVLFGIGALKSRWTRRHWLASGAETFVLGAVAGVAGYVFGSLLPTLLGMAGLGG